jgi:hypothetical protein
MTIDTKTANTVPVNGQRSLSAKETVMRSQALAANAPEKNCPNCTGQIFLGVFFDGTGNNRDIDLPLNSQSNIVRLWSVHRDNSARLTVSPPVMWSRIYIPGVGTPFEELGERTGSVTGNAMANGGQARIFWGLVQTLNTIHRYLTSGSNLISPKEALDFCLGIGDFSSTLALLKLKSKLSELKKIAAGTKLKITQLNISVFGFSRGAAEARTFCNWFYDLCVKGEGSYHICGIPVRIYFLGIFDTVASVGATGADIFKDEVASGHAAWAKGTLSINPAIERCVHFVASHEVRASFPLDSIRSAGKYPSNCYEVIYPGVHSDIGGGYAPTTQGRSPLTADKKYSFTAMVPCIDMHKEALASGVPMYTLQQMNFEQQRNFTIPKSTLDAYNNYIKNDKANGSLEDIFKLRMDRYRFYRYKKLDTYVNEALTQGSSPQDAMYLKITNENFREKCLNYRRKIANADRIIEKNNLNKLAKREGADYRPPEQIRREIILRGIFPQDLEMWNGMMKVGNLASEIIYYFDNFLHDSVAGFAQDGVLEFKYNGRGHFRQRTIYESDTYKPSKLLDF